MYRVEKIVDLSWPVTEETPIYPGDPKPRLSVAATLDRDGYNLLGLSMGSQTGSHVDAPYHLSCSGETIDRIPLDYFFSEAVLIEVTHKGMDEEITLDDVGEELKLIPGHDTVLIRTDWHKKAGSPEFYRHPYVGEPLAKRLIELGVRFLCIDTVNADRTGGTHFPVHELFAGRRLVIGENWRNFDQIDFNRIVVAAFPMNILNADGAPVRAVAMKLGES